MSERFNPAPDSKGFDLFEHWGRDGQHLLAVDSSPSDMTLRPGDHIIKRRWAPAGEPVVINQAERSMT